MRRWGLQYRGRDTRRLHQIGEIFSMAAAVPGKKYKIIKIDGGCRLNSRLCAMGFIPGEVFYVSGASRGGPLCVLVKGTKFAIGRGMAERIQIREV
ncbi:MAG TPA: FeoA domain-containing protein [Candidatus Hydromicrobium sp.]